MNTHGRPSAAELVAAVADFLDRDVRSETHGQLNFHARVAVNALRIVHRELMLDNRESVESAIGVLGFPDEAALATAIRRGELDGRAHELAACLRTVVGYRLTVAHPGYQDE